MNRINRRECLQAGAAALFASPLLAADKPSAITLGFSLYGMRALTLRDAVNACTRIGYQAVELAVMPDWPGDPKKLDKNARRQLREQLAEGKLTLPALMENTPLDGDDTRHKLQLDRLRAAADLGNELVPGNPPLIETILGGKPDEWEKVRDSFAKCLEDWAKIGAAAKTVIAIKQHRFGAMNRPEQCIWLLERVASPWIRCVYDWSHYEQRDLTMPATIKTLAPHISFVHVKDTVLEKGQARFVLPGEGSTDYGALIKQLKDHKFTGCICVEVSGMVSSKKDYDPIAAAKKCFEKLSGVVGK